MEPTVDRDTRAVIARLAAAVAASGLSRSEFATALGTSRPRLSTYLSGRTRPSAHFCARAERLGSALGAAADRRLVTPPVAAALIREHLAQDDDEWCWRSLLQCRDHLSAVDTTSDHPAVDAWEAAPGSTGAPGWDVLLAEVVGRQVEALGVTRPPWTRVSPLSEPWAPAHRFLTPDRVRQQTPDWLRRLNVLVPARDLVSA